MSLQRRTPMKRTGFARKVYPWARKPAKPKPFEAPELNPPAKKRQATLGAGKKTKAWDSARAKLKRKFAAAGITTCELRFEPCWVNNGLGFAHSKKRRNITGNEIEEVALVCNCCHDVIEALPEETMCAMVRRVIADREVKIPSIFV